MYHVSEYYKMKVNGIPGTLSLFTLAETTASQLRITRNYSQKSDKGIVNIGCQA
jgi:hypothetical protein